ncbi:hypothetical protein [Acidiphilium sp.]|uniref:hypothetical protein n=1 Tax=Acidiphilium sp. TaxID=527 RepID=UPI003D061836
MRRFTAGLIALGLVCATAQATTTQSKPTHRYDVHPSKLRGKTFKTLAAAKSACGSSPVVWLNPTGVVFHTSTSKWFGHTRTGTYSCRNVAKAAGYWQSKY